MKRISRVKPDLIVLSDDESSSKSPEKKAPRRETCQLPVVSLTDPRRVVNTMQNDSPATNQSREVTELKQQVAKLEKDKEGAIRMAGEHLGRVEFLECLIDTKQDVVDDAEKNNLVEELQKKVASLTQELEVEKSRAKEERTSEKDKEIALLKSEIAGLKRTMDPKQFEQLLQERASLLAQCQKANSELRKADEERAKDRARINELSRKLAQYSDWTNPPANSLQIWQAQKRKEEELEKKVDSLTKQLEAEKLHRKRESARIEELTRNAGEERVNDQQRIDELTRKLAEAEEASLQLPLPPPPMPPAQDVMELELKVAKLEKDFKDACSIADSAQARVRFMENLINKQTTAATKGDEKEKKEVAKLRKKVSSLTHQLAAEMENNMKDRQRIIDLTRQMAQFEG